MKAVVKFEGKRIYAVLVVVFFALLFPKITPAQIKCGDTGINTAIGCIPFTSEGELTQFILRIGIGIGGGIAFLLMIYAAFMIMTSSGNPQRLNAGKELLWSAISGLLLLLFSVFILKLIGVDILNIPGLT